MPVFGVGVAFIDESAICSISLDETSKGIKEIRQTVSDLAPPTKEFHVCPIESIFSSDSSDDGRDQLVKLLDGVTDDTGREDLVVHLRMLALQKVSTKELIYRWGNIMSKVEE